MNQTVPAPRELDQVATQGHKPTQNIADELSPAMALLVEEKVQEVLKKHYPDLHSGVDLYDFMNSAEMKLYRALLVVVPFGLMIDFTFGVVSILLAILLFLVSGILFTFIKNRKSSVIMYFLFGQGKWLARILFVVVSGLVVYMTYIVADRYVFVAEKIQAFIDMIWANIQTLQNITNQTTAIKDGIVNTANSVGNTLSTTAESVHNRVRGWFE